MRINESETPWYRKTPPGICNGIAINQATENALDQQARIRFLHQSACYLGIPINRYDLETCLVRN